MATRSLYVMSYRENSPIWCVQKLFKISLFPHSNNRTDFFVHDVLWLPYVYMFSHKKNLWSTIRIEKREDFSQMCTKEMGKFSLYYITNHGRIANGRISIPLVISTSKNSYLSYLLSDFSETFTNMFL